MEGLNNTNVNVPLNLTTVKPVAVYCRVSTDNQENEGTSLDTQRAACLKYCQEHNYTATHQFLETWSGLSLERQKLDELRQLVRNGEIAGVIIYCLDRLSRDPTHGVILQEELEKHHVTLEAITETVESTDLGKLISYIRGYAAKLEAEKIRERTMRGTKARVFDKKLPVTRREPFGYSWSKEKERILEPNGDYDTVKLILGMAIDGKSYDYIIANLKKKAILSPSGLPDWNKHTISSIIRNPVYAGRFYAFKSEVVVPLKRNGTTYGKSSVRRLPMDQWHYIPEIEVVDPPITLEQRALLLDQLEKRQKFSRRNAKREYLLRGLIHCGKHTGKEGKPRIYHGIPKRQTHYYTCPEGGCLHPYLHGPEIEAYVRTQVAFFLQLQPEAFYAFLNKGAGKVTAESLKKELAKLERRYESTINNQAKLIDDSYNGKVPQKAAQRLQLKYQADLEYLQTERDGKLVELSALNRQKDAVESFSELRRRFNIKVMSAAVLDSFPSDSRELADKWHEKLAIGTVDWREIFDSLNLAIHVNTKAEREKAAREYAKQGDPAGDGTTIEYPDFRELIADKKFNPRIDIEMRFGIPLPSTPEAEKLGVKLGTVLRNPEPG